MARPAGNGPYQVVVKESQTRRNLMKKAKTDHVAFLLVVLTWAAACNPIEVTYIGSAGYMLESPTRKILIDAPFDDFVKQFEVPVPSQTTQDRIANGDSPFDNIDLLLVTHSHRGHFDFELLSNCMKSNPDAKLVTTITVYNTLENESSDFDVIRDRIVVPVLDADYDTTTVAVDGIQIHVSRSPHWGEEGYLYNYGFNLDGYEILFLLEQDNYVKTTDIDILFCDTLTSSLDPKHIFLSHQYGYATIADLAQQTSTMPEVTFLTTSMQNALVTREKDGTIVIGLPKSHVHRGKMRSVGSLTIQ